MHKTKTFSSRKPYRRKPRTLLQNSKMIKSSNKKYSSAIYLSSFVSLSHVNLRVWGVYKWGIVPPYLYPFNSLTKHKTGAHMSSLTGPTSPRETPNTHYMMLHWGLLPRLTTEVVPQGLDTIKTSRKEANTSPMGVQQHTMIIYIKISSEVTNTSTFISMKAQLTYQP